VEKWYSDDDAPPFGPHLLKPLESCDDILPAMHCEMLDLPVGSSYADAVELFAPSGIYELDLHGYPLWQALELAEDTIRDAWESGYARIKIIHGAPDIKSRMAAVASGRGGIESLPLSQGRPGLRFRRLALPGSHIRPVAGPSQ